MYSKLKTRSTTNLCLHHVRPVFPKFKHHVKYIYLRTKIVVSYELHQVIKTDIGACTTNSSTENNIKY